MAESAAREAVFIEANLGTFPNCRGRSLRAASVGVYLGRDLLK
jgi:hypothetical protein